MTQPKQYYMQYLKLLEHVGLVEEIQIYNYVNLLVFTRTHDLFHSLRHVSPNNTKNYLTYHLWAVKPFTV